MPVLAKPNLGFLASGQPGQARQRDNKPMGGTAGYYSVAVGGRPGHITSAKAAHPIRPNYPVSSDCFFTFQSYTHRGGLVLASNTGDFAV